MPVTAVLDAGYWLLTLVAGALALGLVPVPWRGSERLALSLLLGLTLSTLASYLVALLIGVSALSALAGPVVVLLLAIGGARVLRAPVLDPWRDLAAAAMSGDRRVAAGTLGTGVFVLLLGAALFLLVSRALAVGPGGVITAGYAPTWSDWSVHASYAESFWRGHNLPPTDTLLTGTPLRYPFMADFQSSLLLGLGQSVAAALVVPSWLVTWVAATLLWSLARRLLRSRLAATMALLLMLFGGNLGFARLYPDTCHQLTPAVAGSAATLAQGSCHGAALAAPATVVAVAVDLPSTLTHLPRLYDGEPGTPAPLANLQWWEPLLVLWLPQRDFDYGMALLAAVALAGFVALTERRPRLAVATGLVAGVLPLFNPFGWIAAAALALGWVALYRRREAVWLLLPLLVVGLPRELYDALGPHGQLDNPVGANLFPVLQLGWMASPGGPCSAAQVHAGALCSGLYLAGAGPAAVLRYLATTLAAPSFWNDLVGFWFVNTGLFLPLCLLAALLAWRSRGRALRLPGAPPPGVVRFCAPAFLLFLLANVAILQPWSWDDTKLLAPWYVLAAIPVAGLLRPLLRRGWSALLAAVVLGTLVASGVLAVARSVPGEGPAAQGTTPAVSVPWAGPTEQKVAQVVRRLTPPGAVFLTEGQPNDPVATLAGRQLVLAYDGWLWSYGIPLRSTYEAVTRMFAGCPVGVRRCAATRLMRAHHVAYVELEPGDYNNLAVNTAWFRAMHFPVLVDVGGYVIYEVGRG
ncbi:MAG TPA: hypothetical protein VMW47_00505 [Verrucomicrobiae bacterium]|nr:hypothetical protein [Verrucomicrobiae bacterium]